MSGKGQKEVKKLIAGYCAYICDECVELCLDFLVEEGDGIPKKQRIDCAFCGRHVDKRVTKYIKGLHKTCCPTCMARFRVVLTGTIRLSCKVCGATCQVKRKTEIKESCVLRKMIVLSECGVLCISCFQKLSQ